MSFRESENAENEHRFTLKLTSLPTIIVKRVSECVNEEGPPLLLLLDSPVILLCCPEFPWNKRGMSSRSSKVLCRWLTTTEYQGISIPLMHVLYCNESDPWIPIQSIGFASKLEIKDNNRMSSVTCLLQSECCEVGYGPNRKETAK